MNKYEDDLFIDDSALDVEWLQQPMLMIKYTGIMASARKKFDTVKERISVVKAGIDKEIRSNPEKFGLDKVTETIVMNTIILQKKYKKAQKELIEAQYNWQMAQGAVSAVEHRKQALENLSRLLGLNYFAGPNTPRDLSSAVQNQQVQSRANKAVSMSRKKEK